MGIFATLVLDAWALFLKHGLKQATTDWGMVGRWFGHMPRGVFIHRPIGKSPPVANERLIGYAAHYAIGITYAWLYMVIVDTVLSATPGLLSALVFGLATVAAPWFLMQPGLGMGIMASKVPDPGAKRLASLSAHAAFGIGLYLGWRLVQ
jgi:sulfite exporter TauE/SafE